jgi:hypothetical protein
MVSKSCQRPGKTDACGHPSADTYLIWEGAGDSQMAIRAIEKDVKHEGEFTPDRPIPLRGREY